MKILIGVDGSEGSFEAVRQAGRIAAAGDSIALYYSPPQIRFHEASDDQPTMQQQARAALADAVFAKSAELLPPIAMSKVERIVGDESPRAGIVKSAQDWQADLVVLGARGAGPVSAVKLGNVARDVTRAAGMSVLVTRPRPAGATLRLLLASDGSPSSQQAAAALCTRSWPADAQGFVVSVLEPFFSAPLPKWLAEHVRDESTAAMTQVWDNEYQTDRQQKHDELAAFVKTLPSCFAANEPILREGHAAEEILKTIAENQINLVVVGARGLGTLQRLTMGSTSETLLAQAPCSVLIFRKK
jgi:nucleotide-binding universal stress UspA family protein